MKKELTLRIIQAVKNFKDLEQNIFQAICLRARKALEKVLVLIEEQLKEQRYKKKGIKDFVWRHRIKKKILQRFK